MIFMRHKATTPVQENENAGSELISDLRMLGAVATWILPRVEKELLRWRRLASRCPEPQLRHQALSSIHHKRFHAQGGSIFAIPLGRGGEGIIRLIVALQTISDYLDNLCDRMGCYDELAFRTLHLAMTDATSRAPTFGDYYRHYPVRNDGGYLRSLVKVCKEEISALPSYDKVEPESMRLAKLYSELQVYKHIDPALRELRLARWFAENRDKAQDLTWPEFGAACGSTLGIFALFGAACRSSLREDEVSALIGAYFPWICGLHILLDYLIDEIEDRKTGDLNFVACYPTKEIARKRLVKFLREALERAGSLPDATFHKGVVRGLVALYLSDPRARALEPAGIRRELLRESGGYTWIAYLFCRALRLPGLI